LNQSDFFGLFILKKVVPVFRGGWDWLAKILLAPGATLFAVYLLALCAIVGLSGTLGTHPGEGLWVRLPLALMPFFMLARALTHGPYIRFGAGCLTVGLWLVLAGAWPVGGHSGSILVPPRATQTIEAKNSASSQGVDFAITQRPIWTESFQQHTAGREVSVHAKMQFRVDIQDDVVALIHGQPKDEDSERTVVEFPRGNRSEQSVGGWRMYLDGLEDGAYFDTARLSLTPRHSEGQTIELALGLGTTEVLPDGTTVRLDRVVYKDPLFKSAGVTMTIGWSEAYFDFPKQGIFPELGVRSTEASSAFYSALKDLDARVGQSPWVIRFEGLEKTPFARFGIRKAPPIWPMYGGLILLLLGSLAVAFGRRAAR